MNLPNYHWKREIQRLALGVFLDFSTRYTWYCRIGEGYVSLFSTSLYSVKSEMLLEAEFKFALGKRFFRFVPFFFSIMRLPKYFKI